MKVGKGRVGRRGRQGGEEGKGEGRWEGKVSHGPFPHLWALEGHWRHGKKQS